MSEAKKFLYVNRRAPYGTIYALESLEVVLIGAAFDQDVSLAFIDDGVFQIAKGQDTKSLGVKNFSPTYRALGDYGVTKLYVEKESLAERGLTEDDLIGADAGILTFIRNADVRSERLRGLASAAPARATAGAAQRRHRVDGTHAKVARRAKEGVVV